MKERGEPLDAILARAGATRDELYAFVKRGMALESFVKERLVARRSRRRMPSCAPTTTDRSARRPARAASLTLPPYEDVAEQVRELVRERKLNVEIERWTEQLRAETRVLIYHR